MGAKTALAVLLTMILIGAGGAGAQRPSAGPVQVRIRIPQAGATLPGPELQVALATEGAIALDPTTAREWPAAGLFHVYLDGVDVLQTPLLQFSIQPVPPGPHTLRVTLEDWPDGQAAPAEVAFTLTAGAAPAGTWWMGGTVALVGAALFVGLLLLWFAWVRTAPGPTTRDSAPEAADADEP